MKILFSKQFGKHLITPICISLLLGAPAYAENDLEIDPDDYGLKPTEEHYALKLLGKFIFFDEISRPRGVQSCASCHDPATGWTGPDSEVNLHQVGMTGANGVSIGTLKPPTAAYSSFIPPFGSIDGDPDRGGHFWNGRAEGRGDPIFPNTATPHIGDEVFYKRNGNLVTRVDVQAYARYFSPISDQALNPMPNPTEQNIDRQKVCRHVKRSDYAVLYETAWGQRIKCNDNLVTYHDPALASETNFDISFKRMMLAVGAYEHSGDFNSFSAKRDIYLRFEKECETNSGARGPRGEWCDDTPGNFPLVGLTESENRGHDIFYGITSDLNPPTNPSDPESTGKNAKCSNRCHLSGSSDGTDLEERYTDDRYHNIGAPWNPEVPGTTGIDIGLAGHTESNGTAQHKTPTLRNVDKRPYPEFVKGYGHNGWFKSLKSIVHFYNTLRAKNDTGPGQNDFQTCADLGYPVTTDREAIANNCWPAMGSTNFVAPTFLPFGIGDLGLSDSEEDDVVNYMKTFTDLYTAKPPKKKDLKPFKNYVAEIDDEDED